MTHIGKYLSERCSFYFNDRLFAVLNAIESLGMGFEIQHTQQFVMHEYVHYVRDGAISVQMSSWPFSRSRCSIGAQE